MSTEQQRSRQARAVVHVKRRFVTWEAIRDGGPSPAGYDKDANPEVKLALASTELSNLKAKGF